MLAKIYPDRQEWFPIMASYSAIPVISEKIIPFTTIASTVFKSNTSNDFDGIDKINNDSLRTKDPIDVRSNIKGSKQQLTRSKVQEEKKVKEEEPEQC